jgi:hypothetical protein
MLIKSISGKEKEFIIIKFVRDKFFGLFAKSFIAKVKKKSLL